jgi:polyisoprenoid-binding protein YceI
VTAPRCDGAVELLGRAKDPWGKERAAFEARTAINRGAYGLTWNAGGSWVPSEACDGWVRGVLARL